jgi:hypothetical protein
LEEFGACWEGLEAPSPGNAAPRGCHELLMIALCGVVQNLLNLGDSGRAETASL